MSPIDHVFLLWVPHLVLYLRYLGRTQGHKICSPFFFFPGSFIVLGFPFRSMIHFELLFECGGYMNWSTLFAYGCPIVPFVEKTILLTELLLHLGKKSVLQGRTNLFPCQKSICPFSCQYHAVLIIVVL